MDNGDFVIIINAEKVALTGAKLAQKKAYRHSGYPGGLTATTYAELLEKSPEKAIEKAVRGMCAKDQAWCRPDFEAKGLSRCRAPHAAQQPKPFIIDQVAQ
jgi:large subunit ribosomal protein L13